MRRPATAILVLLVLIQAVLSPLAGAGIALCLGCGHDEAEQVVEAATCGHGCSHAAEVIVAIDVDEHHDGCCTDVEIDVDDQPEPLRVEVVDGSAAPSSPDLVSAEPVTAATHVVTCSPRLDDPGGTHRLLLVRTTRLLV